MHDKERSRDGKRPEIGGAGTKDLKTTTLLIAFLLIKKETESRWGYCEGPC